MKNKYCYRSHISERKFREVLRYFCADLEAKKIAKLSKISLPTINKIVSNLREIIFTECEKASPPLKGEVEVDESYFGAKRVRGKRGRGAGKKIPVFGLLKRNGKVYTQIVSNCSRATLQAIIKERVALNSTIHSDGWKSYDGLVDLGFRKHYRVRHSHNEFANSKSHINGIENFWGIAKVRLSKFRGISKNTFHLHLKECEWRFNNRGVDLYAKMLAILKKNPLKLS